MNADSCDKQQSEIINNPSKSCSLFGGFQGISP